MTKAQAMKLARGKWGKRAAVRDDGQKARTAERYAVGYIAMGVAFSIEGSGDSWEEACRAAGLL